MTRKNKNGRNKSISSDDIIQMNIQTRYTLEEVYEGNSIRGTNSITTKILDIGKTIISTISIDYRKR
jgi:hypothetical protein